METAETAIRNPVVIDLASEMKCLGESIRKRASPQPVHLREKYLNASAPRNLSVKRSYEGTFSNSNVPHFQKSETSSKIFENMLQNYREDRTTKEDRATTEDMMTHKWTENMESYKKMKYSGLLPPYTPMADIGNSHKLNGPQLDFPTYMGTCGSFNRGGPPEKFQALRKNMFLTPFSNYGLPTLLPPWHGLPVSPNFPRSPRTKATIESVSPTAEYLLGSSASSSLGRNSEAEEMHKEEDVSEAKRKRNNEAAKKSRDARREKEDRIALRTVLLEIEKNNLKKEFKQLQEELRRKQEILDGHNAKWSVR